MEKLNPRCFMRNFLYGLKENIISHRKAVVFILIAVIVVSCYTVCFKSMLMFNDTLSNEYDIILLLRDIILFISTAVLALTAIVSFLYAILRIIYRV